MDRDQDRTARGTKSRGAAVTPLTNWLYARWRQAEASLRRIYAERNAAVRAIAPAWPTALVVIIAVVASTLVEQGQVAVLISASHDNSLWSDIAAFWSKDESERTVDGVRVLAYALSLGFFAYAMTVSALFAMSIQGEFERLRVSPVLAAPTQLRIPEDPIHTSVSLRAWVAFLLGAATPLAVVFFLFTQANSLGALNLIVFPAAVIGFAAFGWSMASPLRSLCRRCDTALQARYDHLKFLRRKDARTREHVFAWALRVAPERSSRLVIALRLGTSRLIYWGPFRLLQWLATPPTLAVTTLAVGLSGLALLAPEREGSARLDESIAIICAVTAASFLVYLTIRDLAMRVVGASDRKHLVVDPWVRSIHRGMVLLTIALILGLFWMGHVRWPVIYQVMGPATAALLGLYLVSAILSWVVRTAIMQMHISRPRRRFKSSNVISRIWMWIVVSIFMPLGWVSEQFQTALPAHRLFGLGIFYLSLDRLMLPGLETVGMHGLGSVVLALALGVALSFFAGWAAYSLSARIERNRRAVAKTAGFRPFPKAGDVPRMNSLVLLAPFLLATLGEDRRPLYYRDQSTPFATERLQEAIDRPDLETFAKEWLVSASERAKQSQRAQNTAAPTDGGPAERESSASSVTSVRAIVVLAEGGGIRAAAHVGNLMAHLEGEDPALIKDIYALSGVSGGSVGLATYIAAKASGQSNDVGAMLDQDMLTPLVAGMFGSDLLGLLIPFDIANRMDRLRAPAEYARNPAATRLVPNRADIFESSLVKRASERLAAEDGSQRHRFEQRFQEPMSRVVKDAFKEDEYSHPPVVMFSTFGAENQLRAVASNVAFGSPSGDGSIQASQCQSPRPGQIADVQSCLSLDGSSGSDIDLPLAAAAHISARFPGSNPPAIFEPYFADGSAPTDGPRFHQFRFVDGGYFDNSGAAAALTAVSALRKAAQDLPDVQLEIVVIHTFVRARLDDNPVASAELEFRGYFNEATAPIGAVLGARSSAALFPVSTLCREIGLVGSAASFYSHVVEACEDLAGYRLISSPADPDEVQLVSKTLRDSCGQVRWINAPLDNAAKRTSEGYYLLGWLMRSQTHDRIVFKSQRVAATVADILNTTQGEFLVDADCEAPNSSE